MATIIIFIFYLWLFSFMLLKITNFISDAKRKYWVLLPFFLKIAFGIFYGFSFSKLPYISDTWTFFFNGQKLLRDYSNLNLQDLIKINGHHNFNILSTSSYFEYYRYLVMDYISALFSILSGGRYYVNLIFYNWIIMIGLLKLLYYFQKVNPSYSFIFYWLLLYFPPFLFWTSGFHRDGLCIAKLGTGLYYGLEYTIKKNLRSLIFLLICFLLLLFFRSFWGISFFFVVVIWFLSNKIVRKDRQPTHFFFAGLVFIAIVCFSTKLLTKKINIPKSLSAKQQAFMSLDGNSALPLSNITESPVSFIKPSIQAFDHLLFRPYPFKKTLNFKEKIVIVENSIIWILLITVALLYILKKNKNALKIHENNVILAIIVINYLVIGLTVPFLGAILRYRSPFEMLLLMLLIQFIPISYLNRILPDWVRKAPKITENSNNCYSTKSCN